MKLMLHRNEYSDDSTVGSLFVDGVWECYTLEDPYRFNAKVPGKTCIAFGTYKVVINMSQRFKRLMPQLLDVPEFEGVRIHPGNTAADTKGCILVGRTKLADFVGESREAFATLFAKLKTAFDNNEEIKISIVAV